VGEKSLKERDSLQVLGIDGSKILEKNFKQTKRGEGEGMD
jgi:hypothetical protein